MIFEAQTCSTARKTITEGHIFLFPILWQDNPLQMDSYSFFQFFGYCETPAIRVTALNALTLVIFYESINI